MKNIIFAIFFIFLIAGCTARQVEYLYVCPDGNTVIDRSKCLETEDIVVPLEYNEESNYNATEIEKEIFNLVNAKRAEYGIRSLKWNDDIARIAKAKSLDMAENDYFNHESPDGKTFSDLLRENKIFYLAASENLALIGNMTEGLAQEAVEGWLESPAHRVPILDNDEIFTDTGVGVYCVKRICYFTMQFVNLEKEINLNLKVRYGTFIYIYDPVLDFDYNATVNIELNSTRNTDAYIVDDSDNYDLFMQGYPIYYKLAFKHTDYFNTTIIARKGYGVILYSDPDWVFSDAQIDLKMSYLT